MIFFPHDDNFSAKGKFLYILDLSLLQYLTLIEYLQKQKLPMQLRPLLCYLYLVDYTSTFFQNMSE